MSSKPKQSSETTTRVHIVVTTELKAALKAKADIEGRSLSGLVNYILSEYIKKNTGK